MNHKRKNKGIRVTTGITLFFSFSIGNMLNDVGFSRLTLLDDGSNISHIFK